MSHYRQVHLALAQFQQWEDCATHEVRSPGLAPTTYTNPGDMRQAYWRHFDHVVAPFEFKGPESEPATPARPEPLRCPPVHPRSSIHVAALGPADNWHTPRAPEGELPAPPTMAPKPAVDPQF